MEKNLKNILIPIAILLLIFLLIFIMAIFQKGVAERPSLGDSNSISASIDGFTKAEDLEERMNYVVDSSVMQRNLRSYLIVPFDQREILGQEIEILSVLIDQENKGKKAIAEQKLIYISDSNKKTHHLRITYRLEKEKKWLISDFEARVTQN